MHCRCSLSDDFVIDNTGVSWRSSKYKKYKESLMYDTERARFPEAQINAQLYLNAKQLHDPLKAELKVVIPRLAVVRAEISKIEVQQRSADSNRKELMIVKRPLNKERTSLIKRRLALKETLQLYYGLVLTYGLQANGINVERVKRAFIKACPTTSCNGFLDDDFHCGLCSTDVCKKCHEVMGDGHECNEDIVASVKALKAEARNCPSCATLISKIDGCDQMWCTQCKTTFSWRTGLREQGHTHNPHYYEWMRLNGGLPRAPGDLPGANICGFPLWSAVRASHGGIIIKEWKRMTDNILMNPLGLLSDTDFIGVVLANYHQQLVHHNAINRNPVPAVDNHVLRVKLLTKEIDETKFKVLIQRVDKAYRKSLAKKQIYDMTYLAGGDIMRNCIGGVSFDDTIKLLEALFNYSNSSLKRIANGYSCTVDCYKIVEKNDETMRFTYWR